MRTITTIKVLKTSKGLLVFQVSLHHVLRRSGVVFQASHLSHCPIRLFLCLMWNIILLPSHYTPWALSPFGRSVEHKYPPGLHHSDSIPSHVFPPHPVLGPRPFSFNQSQSEPLINTTHLPMSHRSPSTDSAHVRVSSPKAFTPRASTRSTDSQCPWTSSGRFHQPTYASSTSCLASTPEVSGLWCSSMASDLLTTSKTSPSSVGSGLSTCSTPGVPASPPSPTYEENEAWLLDKGYELPEKQDENEQSGLACPNLLRGEEAEERMENARRRGRLLNRNERMRGDDESRQHSITKTARRKWQATAGHKVELEK